MSKKKSFANVDVVREGKQLVLPEGMDYDEGIKWLTRRRDEENQTVAIVEEIDALPFEGALAMFEAMKQRYGWVETQAKPSFFGPEPPTMIAIETGYGRTEQIPWGQFGIPNVTGYVEFGVSFDDEGFPRFRLTGEVKQRDKGEIHALVDAARAWVREHSIYRGKAVRVKWRRRNGQLMIGPADMPKFMDVSSVRPDELVFPAATQELVDAALFAPLEHTERCRMHRIPLKRGVLLEGPYGTGKTLTAYVTAKKCTENGWTFIYLETIEELATALRWAKRFAPAVIFAEDIDSYVDDDRDARTNHVLNTLDGVDSKDQEVILVLTTNHVENIHPAMLRPGRLDAVIPVRPPDAEATVRLIKLYARGLILTGENLTPVGQTLAGQIPAVIREVVERAKLSALRSSAGETLTLRAADLMTAARGMLAHLELIKPKPADKRSDIEKAADTLAGALKIAPNGHAKNGAVGAVLPLTEATDTVSA